MPPAPWRGGALAPPSNVGDAGCLRTGRPADQRPTAGHGQISFEEAAERLIVTVNAMLRRLKRGTLRGHRTPNGWVAVWPPTRATDRGPTIEVEWSAIGRPTADQPRAGDGRCPPAGRAHP